MDDLLKWRGEFPILEHSTYLISNSLGAMPRAVYGSMRAYADSWAERGVRAWEEGWWEMAVEVGDKIAPLIGAKRGEISLHQNVTVIQAIIASCFDFRGPRNKIVMTDLEFPSIQYFYHEQRRLGARVELVPSSDPVRFDLDKFLAAIDETTLLVPISQVLFRSSHIVNAQAIIERAHRVGAHVILDVFQAAGTIPINVRSLGADFAVGGVLNGCAAARVSDTYMCVKICALSCAQRSPDGLRTAGRLDSRAERLIRAKIRSAISTAHRIFRPYMRASPDWKSSMLWE